MNWKVKKVGVDMYAVMEGNNIIASVYSTMETNKPFGYNANLIAASPVLLDELKRLYEAARCMADPEHCLHEQRESIPWKEMANKAKQAISKAEGRE